MPRAIASPREKLIVLFEALPTAEAGWVYEVLGVLLKRRTVEKAGRMVKMRVAPGTRPNLPAMAQHVVTAVHHAAAALDAEFAAQAPTPAPKAKRIRPSRAKPKPGTGTVPPPYPPPPPTEDGDQSIAGDPGIAPDTYDDGTPEPAEQ